MGIKLKDILSEKFEIDLEVGDTILRGKFKNKPVVVKEFGTDEHGQPTINGKKMLSFRIKKLMPKKESIKLKEIVSDVDSLKYGETVKKSHQNHMDRNDSIFQDFDISPFMSNPPFSNSSQKTLAEMRELETIVSTIDVKKADDITKYFEEYFKSAGLDYPKEEVETLIKDTKGILYKLKYHYNRPRPAQLASAMGLEFHQEPLDTAKTPSYPSGHSSQGRLIGKFLATKYPEHSNEIMKLADEISNARLVAKVHYPSDSIFGLEVGDALFDFFNRRIR